MEQRAVAEKTFFSNAATQPSWKTPVVKKENTSVNKHRLRTWITVLSLILLNGVCFGLFIHSQSPQAINRSYQRELKNYNQVQVAIQSGETAWSIQSKLTPNANIQDLLALDGYINHRDMGSLQAGDVLNFVTSK